MQLRDNKPGIASPWMWCIPGGQVEGIEIAVKREFREETGYTLKNLSVFPSHASIIIKALKEIV